MSLLETPLSRALGIEVPLICGPMYPCSNHELVAAVSAAGGIGVVQPLALSFVHGKDFREGMRRIRSMTDKPIGVNLLLETSVKAYRDRIRDWLDISLEEGVRFFVTSLGSPDEVVQKVHAAGGVVYHDVVNRRWAERAMKANVDGIICVNERAGGHAGALSGQRLYDDLKDLGVPLVTAGGIATAPEYVQALQMGYAGVQMGTRFIASEECKVHADYKAAILRASEEDIVLTDKLSGVPVAVINTPYIERIGTKAGPFARWMLRGRKTKHWMRGFYALTSLWQLRQAINKGNAYKDYWQAGKSAGGIDRVLPAGEIVAEFAAAARAVGS